MYLSEISRNSVCWGDLWGWGEGEFSLVQGNHGEIEGGVNSWSRETRAQNRIQGESKKV